MIYVILVVGLDVVLKKMVGVVVVVMVKYVRLSILLRSICIFFNLFYGIGNIDLIECKVFG